MEKILGEESMVVDQHCVQPPAPGAGQPPSRVSEPPAPPCLGLRIMLLVPMMFILYLRGFILVSAILAPITPARADGGAQAGSHMPVRAARESEGAA